MTHHYNRRDFLRLTSLGSLGFLLGCSVRSGFDYLLKNGMVLDGLGHAPEILDVGIREGRIAAIGDLSSATADRVLDLHDLAVAPGFIDIHTHTDVELLVNPKAESKLRQGVTTEVAGNCGGSPFPLNSQDRKNLREDWQERYGMEVTWEDIAGFFRELESRKIALNYASFTGHGDLRACVVGKNDVPATTTQLGTMKRLLAQSLEHGSLGLSSGLEYAPGSYAGTEELIELCRVVGKRQGVYATHMRNEDDTVEEAIAEALRICREAGVSLQISHLKACNRNNWHKVDRFLETIRRAAEDLPVRADRYPYDAWGTGLSSFLPLWARQGETEEILARLVDPEQSRRIREYADERAARIGGWDQVMISNCGHGENAHLEGQMVLNCADNTGVEPSEFVRRLLIEERNQVGVVGFAMDENNLRKVLAAEFVMIGSDGNAVAPYGKLGRGKPHPRFYGTFPRVLGKYCREEKVLDLPTAVKKMTSMPAEKLGFRDRGVLQPGKQADITVFNPETVIDRATFRDPHQFPAGIEYVFVNGVLVVYKGEHTGELPGRVLRSS